MEINPADEIDKCEAGGGAEPQPADPEPEAASSAAAALEQQQQPPWREQLTARGLVAAALIGFMYTVVVMKLNLTTGFVPTMNVSAALLAFLALRGWTGALARLGVAGARPFTRQENTVVQTCAVACYSLALCGFGSFMLGLNKRTYEAAGVDTPGNVPGSVKEPGFGWITGFLVASSFGGLLTLIPLRKALVIDYKLTYPSGTATAVLINGFHTPQGDKNAECHNRSEILNDFAHTQLQEASTCISEILRDQLLLELLPVVLHRWQRLRIRSVPYVWPQGLETNSFVCIALIMGDGIYHFVKVLGVTAKSLHERSKLRRGNNRVADEGNTAAIDDLRRDEVFNRDSIPAWLAYAGCGGTTWWPRTRCLAPVLGFSNSYGAGLTDINMGYSYGQLALFVLAAWAGRDDRIVAGLVGCGLVKQLVLISADLMHDFKTAHLTLTSPRSMLATQAVGAAIGCVVTPLTFLLFYRAFDVGNPNGYWKAPFALIYRNMALLGAQGFSALPTNCLPLSAGFFAFAVLANVIKDVLPPRYARYVPLPTAMAVPFLVGASFAIDMVVGTLVVFAWQRIDGNETTLLVPAVASGLICGDGIWTFPSSLLSLAKIKPPMCLKFTPGS
ncbi:unnamed protein product [Miscanthus lutarioriparius]|uniref:Uncharacterized protein n=1 Tax=Miscanthus lutarioriparius TaxID=422564 RepID=A0A811PFJ4_9POAL|nr:unnamed protein product [Miscanthus lutarioriparius]